MLCGKRVHGTTQVVQTIEMGPGVLLKWSDEYGGILRVKFLWHDGLVVTDPAALAAICGRGEGALDKAAGIYSPINFMCAPRGHANLLTSPADDSWKAVRKAVALSFAFSNIRKKFPIIRDRTGELVQWLQRVGPAEAVDVDQAALRVTLDVIGLTAFGHDYGCVRLQAVPPSHLLRVLPRAFTEVMRRIANPLRAVAPALFKNGAKGVQEAVAAELRSVGLLVRAAPEGGPSAARPLELDDLKRLPYLTACVKASARAGAGAADRGCRSDGCGRAPWSHDDPFAGLTKPATCEAMRMFPVVSIMGRVTERPTRVGPYLVPAGTPVGIPLFAIQNTIHNWTDPLHFKPERWLDAPTEAYVMDMRMREGRAKPAAASTHVTAADDAAPAGPAEDAAAPAQPPRPRGSADDEEEHMWEDGGGGGGGGKGGRSGISFMPFSEGPRSCVGQSLAKLEVLTVLAMLLSHFRIELAEEMGGREGVIARESTHLTLQTRGTRGIRMHLHPREREQA
ncbi:Cytochrome P450 72C1 [Tetrabaena socialis]|uniref:Cytochrome P450 72C1 n=1 Tax=Tetrabaena socialis TaxID=47790 RepID=A0A2J7ZZV1_9CHLO|nr:Cytochrome P450 72C1 [Tetrabaena socialis]|eukprot:PNH05794.1 Cytochrome P450 72C1 [Tetrabaena socialis]